MMSISIEFLKIYRLRATRVILLAMALVEVLMLVGVTYSLNHSPESRGLPPDQLEQARIMTSFPAGIPAALSFAATLGPLLAIILAAHIVGCEYSWGTMRQMVSTGQDRARYILIKAAGVLLSSLFITMTSGIAGGIGLFFTPLVGGQPPSLEAVNAGFLFALARAAGIAWLCLSFYSLLALLLTTMTKSATPGMALGLLLFFLEGGLMEFLARLAPSVRAILPYTIGHNITAIQSLLDEAGRAGTAGGGAPFRALAVLLVYAAGFLWGAIEIARQQELGTRTA